MNSTIFTAHCQAWLDDLTRLQVTHGLCQPEIKKWHRLTVTSCSLPNGLTGLLIIPQFLLTVTQAACVEEESVAGRIIKRAEGQRWRGCCAVNVTDWDSVPLLSSYRCSSASIHSPVYVNH